LTGVVPETGAVKIGASRSGKGVFPDAGGPCRLPAPEIWLGTSFTGQKRIAPEWSPESGRDLSFAPA